ncbi:MAG: hypothetical protein R3242_04655 [Akkermansiaceae bacterium]|nr:hypothetical protein [Akkermansiaceae bacterium]
MSTLRTWIQSIALLLALATPGLAQQHEFMSGKNSLRIEFPHGHVYQYGFQLVRVTATNVGSKPATWKTTLKEEVFNFGMRQGNTGELRLNFEVAPGEVVQRDILMVMGNRDTSDGGGYWNEFTVSVDMPSGIVDNWSHRAENSHGFHPSSVEVAPALYSRDAIGSLLDTYISHSSRSAAMSGEPATDWRAYSAFALVVMTPAEWVAMPPAARMALMDWVRLGGMLQFIGSIPESVPERSPDGVLGLGKVFSHDESGSDIPLQKLKAFQTIEAMRADISSKPELEARSFDRWLRENGLHELLDDEFAIWLVVLVLIAFFVMITPVNLFLLAPSRRRHRLFKTIPIISLAACLALALAVVMGDGIGGNGQRLVLIESRSGDDNLHYISQWQASDCGALFGSGFKVTDPAYMAPLGDLSSDFQLDIVPDGLEAGGGWFASRSVQAQYLQAVRSSRGRIEWSQDSASYPVVTSTFDFDVVDFHTRDKDGKWWHAPALTKGRPVQLKPVDNKTARQRIQRHTSAMPREHRIRDLSKIEGHYIAFTDQPPAIDTHGAIDWDDKGIVIGEIIQP